MLSKPQVKKELVVALGSGGIWCDIHVTSRDATTWVQDNCAEFGSLSDSYLASDGKFTLFLKPNYDADEVVAYIDSYNDRLKTTTLPCPMCEGTGRLLTHFNIRKVRPFITWPSV